MLLKVAHYQRFTLAPTQALMLTTELIKLGGEALQKFSIYPLEECGQGDDKSRLELLDAVYYLGGHWMAVGKNGQFPLEIVSTLAQEENP